MKLAIMQPYLFPYIGYFQLMASVDEFVVYDNIEFTKKGWINRNRILVNGQDAYISIPLKKDSDYLDVRERRLADTWEVERKKMLNRITESYRKAKYFEPVYPVVQKCILFENVNLFEFILNTLLLVKEYLGIGTPLVTASTIEIDHALKAELKVIEICKARRADTYLNPIGGVELYSKENFREQDIELLFLKCGDVKYKQLDNDFIPSLSIVDVMMFNAREDIQIMLENKILQ